LVVAVMRTGLKQSFHPAVSTHNRAPPRNGRLKSEKNTVVKVSFSSDFKCLQRRYIFFAIARFSACQPRGISIETALQTMAKAVGWSGLLGPCSLTLMINEKGYAGGFLRRVCLGFWGSRSLENSSFTHVYRHFLA